MSGYIGTKSVTLSTTSATVGGDSTVGGDLTVDTNTLYVDSANNRVGVGTATPSTAILDIFTGSSSQDGLKINRFATGTYYSTLRQDTHGLAIHVGDGSTISERAAITPNGITFNGDTAAANALSDYEEGTHHMQSGLTTSMVLNPLYTHMKYVKIGNQVFCSGYINHTTVSGAATSFQVSLPFASVSTANNAHGAAGGLGVMHEYLDLGTGYVDVNWYIASGSSVAKLYESRDNNSWNQIYENRFSTSTSLYFNFNYKTA